MKKILALVLAMIMALSMGVAFAEEPTQETEQKYVPTLSGSGTVGDPYTAITFRKTYTVNGVAATDNTVYPKETLRFEVSAVSGNPTNEMITIEDYTMTGTNPNNVTIKMPTKGFSKVGKYTYKVTEIAGTTQGVTYATNTEIYVQVVVLYDDKDADNDNDTSEMYVSDINLVKVTTEDGETKKEKVNEIVNNYDVGSLTVSKEVTGTMGDRTNDVFDIYVTFNKENKKTVADDIDFTVSGDATVSYMDGKEKKTITDGKIKASLINEGTKFIVTTKHGGSVVFNNIAQGVNYDVVEADYTTGTINTANYGYDKAKYSLDNADATESSVSKHAVMKADTGSVKVINNKGSEPDTGMFLDNAPYMIIMALVLVGAAMMLKRRAYND